MHELRSYKYYEKYKIQATVRIRRAWRSPDLKDALRVEAVVPGKKFGRKNGLFPISNRDGAAALDFGHLCKRGPVRKTACETGAFP
jgi:hypothetical protein